MRWRSIAIVSLGVNLLLGAVWLIAVRGALPARAPYLATSALAATNQAKTNIVVRRQLFSWQEIESADYAAYVANLRLIGCPEQTIRDIIIADVNGLFARKRAIEVVSPEQQWWRTSPDTNVVQAAAQKARELEDDRRALLTKLLGPNWEAGDIVSLPRPSRPGIVLDGPQLGELPAESKQAIQQINERSQERLQAYLEAQKTKGEEPDPLELAKLRQQTRAELQKILSSGQLEEFLLRYSQNANNLRADFGQLRYFNPTPDEFRAAFRATDTLDQQLQLLGPGDDPNTVSQRKALEAQRENALKLALGAKRYEEYRNLQDPLYRDAVATAQAAGTPEAARDIYAINLAAASEQDRIRADTNLTKEQKDIKLKELDLDQTKANAVAAGQELPPEPPTPAPPPRKRTHVILPGDSVAVVALMYGVPVSAIQAANPKVNLRRLKPGDSIFIPASPPTPLSVP